MISDDIYIYDTHIVTSPVVAFHTIMMNNRSKNYIGRKGLTESSIDQTMSMFDAYEEYRSENIIEIFLSDFTEGNSVRPYENLWFFTRC